MAMLLLLCGCAKEEEKPNPYEVIREQVEISASALPNLYWDVNLVTPSNVDVTRIEEAGDGTYDVYGKVHMTDRYGDKWEVKFYVSMVYDETTGEADNSSKTNLVQYDEPTRSN